MLCGMAHQEREVEEVKKLRKEATVKHKEWKRPASPLVVRSVRPPTCPLTPMLMTDRRAKSKQFNVSAPSSPTAHGPLAVL